MKNLLLSVFIVLMTATPMFMGCQGSPTDMPILPGGDLMGINLEPQNVVLNAGNVTKFLATGIFPGGVMFDLTPFVSWTSSDPAVAFFLSDGTLVANSPGTTVIKSNYDGTSSQTVTVTVPGAPSQPDPTQPDIPVLRGIMVTPKFANIDEGETIQYNCMGVFSDGSEQDYTFAVEWRMSNPELGYITQNGMFYSIVGDGVVTVSARYGVFESNYVVLAINATP